MEIGTERFIAEVRDGIIGRIDLLEEKLGRDYEQQQKLHDAIQEAIRSLEKSRNRQEGRYTILVVVVSALMSLSLLFINHWIGKF